MGFGQELGRPLRGRTEHLAQLGAAIAAHHDRLPPRVILAGQAGEITEESHSTISDDVSLCHPGNSVGRSRLDRTL